MSDEGFAENTVEFEEGHYEDEGYGVENEREKMAFLRSNKRTPIDRLSVLPDSLIVHILSFLHTKEAGRTSVLSKRWKFLWTELPKLELGQTLKNKQGIEKTREFVSLVSRTLDMRKLNYLEELKVRLLYDECFASDVDAWIEFSVQNKVKKFRLITLAYWGDYKYYTPPQILYSSSSLTTLHLNRCIMACERAIEWQSLTSLCLQDVELNLGLINDIVSSCPVLCDLELERCWGFSRLEVNSRCLENLEIEESENEPFVEISAPYIRNLGFIVSPQETRWQLENIASVVGAYIDILEFDGGCTVEVMSNVKEFLENFEHVKVLLVRRHCFEVLSIMAMNGWQLPQSRVRSLTLVSCSEYKHSISGIIGLLESSPNLERLVLDGNGTRGETFNLDPATKVDLDGDLLHLKIIRVNNFADSNGEPLLTLAQILLRRAPVLEEMVIVIDIEDAIYFASIAQALLTYSRSSTKAKIRLFTRNS